MSTSPTARPSLFSFLDDHEQRALFERRRPLRLLDGEYVFRAGDPAASLYQVQSGKVQVVVDTYEGESITVAEVELGEVFGEVSFFDGGPRTASARALGDTELREFTRESLLEFLTAHPHAALDFLAVMGSRLRKTDDLLRSRATRNVNEEEAENLTLGDRVADQVASFGGSWPFIFIFAGVLLLWVTVNSLVLVKAAFDPYPYILLNLFLSMLAAIQAPVIMMSQNRHAAKDRLKADLDYRIDLKAELKIAELHKRFDVLHALLNSSPGQAAGFGPPPIRTRAPTEPAT